MPSALIPPHRRRSIILGLIFCTTVLSYFDRQIVSVLKPTLKIVFGTDDRGYALVVNAFTLCYAIAFPLAGWLVDRFGPGRIMLGGIISWSGACLAVVVTRTFGQFAACRALLGLAEPASFPAQLRAVAIWFPPAMRATAYSICAAGSTIGAVIAPPAVAWLALRFGWRAAFLVPGAVGLVLALLWRLIWRNPPAEILQAAVGPAGPSGAFGWLGLWRTRSLWGIILCRFVSDPVWYFCLFWLPGYLQERLGLTLAQLGIVGWIPFLAADVGGIGSSSGSDYLVRRGIDPLRARKLVLTGAACCAPLCVLTTHIAQPVFTLAIFSLVGAVCLTWLFGLGIVVAEAFPLPNVGSAHGIAAAFGAAGAIVFNTIVGRMIGGLGINRMFAVMALLHPLAAVILWALVRRERPAPKAQIDIA